MPAPSPLQDYVDDLQARGKLVFHKREALAALGSSEHALDEALRRLGKKKRVARLRKGVFAIVPIEYRIRSAPPASWVVGPLMGYLERPYYVGVLTAAALHGAAHQAPQVFQVVIDRPEPKIVIERFWIDFLVNRYVNWVPTVPVKVPTGYLQVSTPEATALDLVRYPRHAGGLHNIATVLQELVESMDGAKLAALVPGCPYDGTDLRRLGYLLDFIDAKDLADALHEAVFREDVRAPVRQGIPEDEPLSRTLERVPDAVFWREGTRGGRVPDYSRIFGWYLREKILDDSADAQFAIRSIEEGKVANLSSFQRHVAKEARRREPSTPLRADLEIADAGPENRWGIVVNEEVEPDL